MRRPSLISLAALAMLAGSLPPPPPRFRYMAVRDGMDSLRLGMKESAQSVGMTDVIVREKPSQVADAWVFVEEETFRRYMDGQLTELDLVGLTETGKVKPTKS